MAERIARWLIDRGEHRVVVVGHSMGAVVALMLAEQHPELVACVVDIEGNKTDEDRMISGLVGSQTLGEFLTGGFEDLMRPILIDEIPRKNCCGFDDRAYKRYLQSLQVCSLQAFFEHAPRLRSLSFNVGLAARLGALYCTKFFVTGRPRGAWERSRHMVEMEGIPISVIHPAGHWPFIDQADMSSWLVPRIFTYFSS